MDRQKRCVELGNLNGLMALDLRFHELLFRFADKMQCYEYVTGMTIHMDRLRNMALRAVKTPSFVNQHEMLVNAIEAGNASAAEEIMRKHVARYLVDREALMTTYPEYVKK